VALCLVEECHASSRTVHRCGLCDGILHRLPKRSQLRVNERRFRNLDASKVGTDRRPSPAPERTCCLVFKDRSASRLPQTKADMKKASRRRGLQSTAVCGPSRRLPACPSSKFAT